MVWTHTLIGAAVFGGAGAASSILQPALATHATSNKHVLPIALTYIVALASMQLAALAALGACRWAALGASALQPVLMVAGAWAVGCMATAFLAFMFRAQLNKYYYASSRSRRSREIMVALAAVLVGAQTVLCTLLDFT